MRKNYFVFSLFAFSLFWNFIYAQDYVSSLNASFSGNFSASKLATVAPVGWSWTLSATNDATLDASGEAARLNSTSHNVRINLGVAEPTEVTYLLRNQGTGNRTMLVQHSQDGTTWTTAATHTQATVPFTTTLYSTPVPSTANFIRFTMTLRDNGRFELDGINVIGTGINPTCIPTYANDCTTSQDFINRFSTTLGTTNITNNGSGCNGQANNYIMYPNRIVSAIEGNTFNVNMRGGTSFAQGFRIWVDWNGDGDFSDSGENVYNSGVAATTAFNTSITIPPGTTAGSKVMRVRCAFDCVPEANQSCGATCMEFGETEDYIVQVLPTSYSSQLISMNLGASDWCVGETRSVSVRLKNIGTATWFASGSTTCPAPDNNNQVALTYKWNADANFDAYVNNRNLLPNNVLPGQEVDIVLDVHSPNGGPIGPNNITFKLIARECAWFGSQHVSQSRHIRPYPSNPNAGSDATICVGGSTNLSGSADSPTDLGTTSYTHTTGDGDTRFVANPTVSTNNNTCPLDFSVTIPSGATITGVDVSYNMTALAGGYLSEQRSYLQCLSTGGAKEASIAVGTGESEGTLSYSRTGLTIANSVTGGGAINFRLHGFRTWEGTAGCHATVNKIDNNTVVVKIYYTYQPTLTYSWSPATGLSASNISNPVANPTSTTNYTMTVSNMGCSVSDNVTVSVGAASVSPTGVDVVGLPVCHNGTITLSPIGGSLASGANWEYFSGSCATTVLGTGSTLGVTPLGTTDYFIRASAGTGCPPSSCATTIVTLPSQGTTLSVDGEDATCRVDDSGWVHFYNASGNLIASINSNGQDLGEVLVTTHIANDPYQTSSCTEPLNESFFQANLQRTFVVTPEFQPASPVQIRLYLLDAEIDAYIAAAAATIQNADDNIMSLADLNMSKVSSGVLGGNPENLCSVGGSVTYIEKDAYGNINTLSGFNGFTATSYLEFTIDGFSEFFPMKTDGSPLPVSLTNFSASCQLEKVLVNWTTASELNASHYVLQSSRDGHTWFKIAEIPATGTTNQESNYGVDDINNGALTYYRLVQVDLDGAQEIFGPISSNCTLDESSLSVYPNPTNDNFTVYIQSNESFTGAVVELTDMSGRVLTSQTTNLNAGSTMLNFEAKALHAGTYMVRVKGQNDKFTPIRVVRI